MKDVLRFIATEKPDSEPSWDERGGVDGLSDEVWTWASSIFERFMSWSRSIIRR